MRVVLVINVLSSNMYSCNTCTITCTALLNLVLEVLHVHVYTGTGTVLVLPSAAGLFTLQLY